MAFKLLPIIPILALFSSLVQFAQAAPIPAARPIDFGDVIGAIGDTLTGGGGDENKAAPVPLSAEETAAFTSTAQFARAAYCSAPAVLAWNCGEACDANPDTEVLFADGDDGLIPGFFVAFSPPTSSIIVAHQGTEPSNILSILNDVNFFFEDPTEEQFPGARAAGVKIHDGFLYTFNRTADVILKTVKRGIATKKATNVIITGHSLGGAISLLDTVFLRRNLPAEIPITSTLFGLPRMGNAEFANFVAASAASDKLRFFVNNNDPVPKVPPTSFGFIQPAGELFAKDGAVSFCPGQENENCFSGLSILDSDVGDHAGPYAGVSMGSSFCSA